MLLQLRRTPVHLCPLELRKIHSSVNHAVGGFELVPRYRRLEEFYRKHRLEAEASWAAARAAALDIQSKRTADNTALSTSQQESQQTTKLRQTDRQAGRKAQQEDRQEGGQAGRKVGRQASRNPREFTVACCTLAAPTPLHALLSTTASLPHMPSRFSLKSSSAY